MGSVDSPLGILDSGVLHQDLEIIILELKQMNLNSPGRGKSKWIVPKKFLEKSEQWEGGCSLSPDIKLYFKVIVIETVWHRHWKVDQWDKVGNSK